MKKLLIMPALKFIIFFIAGIIIGSNFKFNPILLSIVVVSSTVYSIYIYRKSETEISQIIAFGTLIFTLGIYKANIDFFYIPDNSVKYIPDTEKSDEELLIGIVSEPAKDKDSIKLRFVLECESLIRNDDTIPICGSIIINLSPNEKVDGNDKPPDLKPGDKISLFGQLSIPPGERKPGEFNYQKYLEIQNINKLFYVSGFYNVELISNDNLNFVHHKIVYPAREYANRTIDETIGGDEGAFLKGLVTGERSDITKDTKQNFVNAGVMHLIAVSGLNVAYVILFLNLFLSVFRIKIVPRYMIIIIFIFFYIFFSGATASILRAAIMGLLILIAYLIERKPVFYNIRSISIIVILIYDSKQLYDPGFILSYSAAISMVYFYEKFDNLFLKNIKEKDFKLKKAISFALINVLAVFAAQIGTLPITSMYFGKISIIAFLANLIAIPLSNFSLALGFLQIIVSLISGLMASAIADLNFFILKFQLLLINFFGSLDFAYTTFFNFTFLSIIIYYICAIFLFTAPKIKFFYRLVMVLIIFIGLWIYNIKLHSELKITFLDVGQGDCTLIETPDNNVILVDCGLISKDYTSAESQILPYLQRNSISKIDILIISHKHSDHIGGLPYLIDNIKIGKIIESGETEKSEFLYKIDSTISANRITKQIMRAGDEINEASGLNLFF